MNDVLNAVGIAAILLMLGWLKLDLNRLSDRVDHLAERIDVISERVARIEGRLDGEHR